jgi:hypothetical protein
VSKEKIRIRIEDLDPNGGFIGTARWDPAGQMYSVQFAPGISDDDRAEALADLGAPYCVVDEPVTIKTGWIRVVR